MMQSDKQCDNQVLIKASSQRDDTTDSKINIRTPLLSNLDKSTSSSVSNISSVNTVNGYGAANKSTQFYNRGSLCDMFQPEVNTVDKTVGLGLAESVATNWSAVSESDKINRPIKVNKNLEHGSCVSNATCPADGFSDSATALSCPVGSAVWHNKDSLTCEEPRPRSIAEKSDANFVHQSQEMTHLEQASVTSAEFYRDVTGPLGQQKTTASLLTVANHVPPDISSSSFSSLSTQPQLLSYSGTDPNLPARPVTTTSYPASDCVASFSFNTPRTLSTLQPPPLSLTSSSQSAVPAPEAAESDSKLSHHVTYTATTSTPLSCTQAAPTTASLLPTVGAGTGGKFTKNIRTRHRLIDTQSSPIPVIEEAFDFACHYTAGVLQGLPPLFLATAERNATTLRLLLKYGANPNYQDSEGCTPLHLSASVEFQSWECAVALIEHGAKVHIPNRYGTTPAVLSADLTKEHIRILTDTLINTILSTRLLCADIQQQSGSKKHSPRDYIKSHSGSEGWSTLSAKFRKRRSSHCINAEALVRKASTKDKRQREGSFGRSDLLSTGSDWERTSSLSSTRSRFSFNFANKHSTSPPPSNFEDSEMDSKGTDPERVSTL